MDLFMLAAIDEAKKGLAEGGIPIGSVIVHKGKIIGRGHNRRVQQGSAILHGEMDALRTRAGSPRVSTVSPSFIQRCRHAQCAAEPFYCTVFRMS